MVNTTNKFLFTSSRMVSQMPVKFNPQFIQFNDHEN